MVRVAVLAALDRAREVVASRHQPDGFNIGVNVGPAAGQTVFHLHVHLFPRYRGDVADPRGGVRHVIPQRGNYLGGPPPATSTPLPDAPDVPRLVHGGDDPLLPYLVEQFARAKDADLAVGFVLGSGVTRLEAHLQDLLSRGGRVRLVTGDYLGVTDPDALVRLLDLDGGLALRVFETVAPDRPAWPGPTAAVSFHPKAYIFHVADGSGVAFVGSSNLTQTALTTGVEWNYRVVSSAEGTAFAQVVAAFEQLCASRAVVDVTPEWIERYRARRHTLAPVAGVGGAEVPPEPREIPEPHAVQTEALAALARTREEGYRAGLVVMATGLGKTWLAAFDTAGFRRILFVAHREEILG